MQLVEIDLNLGQAVRAEAGALSYMSSMIEMQTTMGGDFLKGLERIFTGESFFITTFTKKGQTGAGRFRGSLSGKDYRT